MSHDPLILDSDYEPPPQRSRYLHLNKMEPSTSVRFQVLTPTSIGWEWWTEDAGKYKPNRVETPITDLAEAPIPAYAKVGKDRNRPKHIWANVVYNYDENCLQILSVHQSTVQSGLRNTAKEWGSPTDVDYTFVITAPAKDQRAYSVQGVPANALPADAKRQAALVDLGVLFDGGDPWEALDADVPISDDGSWTKKGGFSPPAGE